MTCTNCGTENRPGRRFCMRCGQPLTPTCPSCGAENEPEALFCGNCGTALAEGEAPTAAASSKPTAQAAERRLVTVLFADLVGSTPFAEKRDAEEVRETLNSYFQLVREIVARYGGMVEKFIGDAVMAVWGTPTAHEDDAERAVRAALELVDSVPTLGEGMAARAGVLTGEAAVNVGAREQGMIAGDLVNTASRLQAIAGAGTVLVGESTMRAASAAIDFEPAGNQALKGKQVPLPAWRATRIVAQRGGAGRSDALETPFVGRDDEFRLLREAFYLSGREPRARLVAITGPAGIGKSRLAWELERYIDGLADQAFVHRGRCPAYGEGVTFWALGEMVRERAGLAEGDDEQTTRRRVAGTIDEFVADPAEREWITTALLTLLGAEQPAAGSETLFAAWRRFFERIAERGTTVLLFEDLQSADSGLLDFIDHLLDWSQSAPLLVITLARPELFDRHPDWDGARRSHRTLALDPLSDASMREMLAALVPDLPEPALAAIVGRADGIPLYAVETVRMLLADGRIERANGSYRTTGDLGDLDVPESLRSLIAARLDALEPADRSLLQEASVLGQTFTLDSLAAVRSTGAAELAPRLRQLVRRELLTLQADPRSPERGQYGFTQALVREVAYATLSRADRRARHLAAARHFESVGGGEIAAILAEHYRAAHRASSAGPEADAVAAQARVALRAAADRAAALGSHEQAASFLEQALALAGEPVEQAVLYERVAREQVLVGRYEAAEANARKAVELYREAGDADGVASASAALGLALVLALRLPDAIRELKAAAGALTDDVEPQARAQLLAELARAYYRDIQPERSIETADEALRIAERWGLRRTIGHVLASKGSALAYLGRFHEEIVLLRGAASIAREEGDNETLLRATFNITPEVALYEGREKAAEIHREGVAIAERVGDLGALAMHLGGFAGSATLAGWELDPIIARLEELLAMNLPDAVRLRPVLGYSYAAGMRGRDVSEQVEWVARTVAQLDDEDLRLLAAYTASLVDITRGEWTPAARRAFAATEPREDVGFALPALLAAVGGDWPLVQAALDRAAGRAVAGKGDQALLLAARSALQASTGEREAAVAGLREALRMLRASHDRLLLGGVALMMVRMLGPDDADARTAADEALAIFERMGAEPMIRQLREALGAGAATVAPTAQVVADQAEPAQAPRRP